MLQLDLKFSITPQQMDLDFEKLQKVTEVVTENDHNKLINRDMADQHPIAAITGLESSLASINEQMTGSTDEISEINQTIEQINQELETKVEGEALTNEEVAGLWNRVMG